VPLQAGLDYWVQALGSGMPRHVMIEAVKNGAQGIDRIILDNKTEVGLYHANSGLEGSDFYLFGITQNPDTVEAAKIKVFDLGSTQK
jgi:hypothetical protein